MDGGKEREQLNIVKRRAKKMDTVKRRENVVTVMRDGETSWTL